VDSGSTGTGTVTILFFTATLEEDSAVAGPLADGARCRGQLDID
jgi:hypothetical protein